MFVHMDIPVVNIVAWKLVCFLTLAISDHATRVLLFMEEHKNFNPCCIFFYKIEKLLTWNVIWNSILFCRTKHSIFRRNIIPFITFLSISYLYLAWSIITHNPFSHTLIRLFFIQHNRRDVKLFIFLFFCFLLLQQRYSPPNDINTTILGSHCLCFLRKFAHTCISFLNLFF